MRGRAVRRRCAQPLVQRSRKPGASWKAGSSAKCTVQWQRWRQEPSVNGGFSWCVSLVQRTGFAAGTVPLELCFLSGLPLLQGPWREYQINKTAQHHLFELRVFLQTLYFPELGDSALLFNPGSTGKTSSQQLLVLRPARGTAFHCSLTHGTPPAKVLLLRNWRHGRPLPPVPPAGAAARRPAPALAKKRVQTPASRQSCRLRRSGRPTPALPSSSGQRRPAPA